MDRKKLPVGIQTFDRIRKGDYAYYYVDKTAFIERLINEGAVHHFLSRPRRFGKSLLVDTMKNLFVGNKELFEGLYIHDKWDWDLKYPVVRLDFGGWVGKTPDDLNEDVMTQLRDVENQECVSTTAKAAGARFFELVRALHEKKKQRVVILVDEYDKPILDTLGTPELAEANRDYLRGLYGNIKRCEADIRFSFLTGVSKFSRAGIFSGLNNLRDITLKPEFSSICGYTDHDLDTVFAPELENLERLTKIDREEIKEWYNGYNWCGDENVYNPFNILQLFDNRKLEAWWYDTGTSTFLINELKKHGSAVTLKLAGMSADNTLLSTFDIGDMGIPALLFQSGYLTIAGEKQSGGETFYQLDFPNREVRQSLNRGLMRAIEPKAATAVEFAELRGALQSVNFDAMKLLLHAILSGIPGRGQWDTMDKIAEYEAHYAGLVYLSFMATGLVVRPEDPTSRGRIDTTVETGAAIYICEFKVLRGEVKRGDAMKQLRERRDLSKDGGWSPPGDRRYRHCRHPDFRQCRPQRAATSVGKSADKYRGRGIAVYLVGIEFDIKERNIKHLDYEPAWPEDESS